MKFTDLIIPLVTVGIFVYAAVKRVDVFSAFCEGAEQGLTACRDIIPPLVLLLVCVGMFRASGAVEALTELLKPVCGLVGFPAECVSMVLLRPFSGSGAIALYNDIAATSGADSLAERTAAVLLGSSETTFYTIAVYFSAVKVKDTRHALPAALTADLTAWIVCGITVFAFFG